MRRDGRMAKNPMLRNSPDGPSARPRGTKEANREWNRQCSLEMFLRWWVPRRKTKRSSSSADSNSTRVITSTVASCLTRCNGTKILLTNRLQTATTSPSSSKRCRSNIVPSSCLLVVFWESVSPSLSPFTRAPHLCVPRRVNYNLNNAVNPSQTT